MSEAHFIDKRRARRSFSRAARDYDAAAVLQREVRDRMLARLDYVRLAPRRVLDAGSGTGHGARALRARYPDAQVLELDLAEGMLREARRQDRWWRRGGWLGRRLPAVCADLETLPLAAECVDLYWSSLALQWVNDLPRAFAEARRVLAVDGLLMFATFGPDTLRELRAAFAAIDGWNHVNRFTDLHDIGDMLVEAGFAAPVIDMEYVTMTYPDVTALMRDLKAIGAHNATRGRAPGLAGRRWLARLAAEYEPLRRDGRLPATFEVVYGHAWKPRASKSAGGEAIVRFEPRPRAPGAR